MTNASAAPNSPVHPLVVDDDAFVRGVVVRQLATIGVANALAAGDWSAARVLLDRSPTCNLVISDLDMPGASGSSFLDELARMRPGIALIIISATERIVLQAAEKHARKLPLRVLGSMAKPTSVDALRALLTGFNGG
jgi:DNA-binding NtrC family response regulator